jgi:hypothetical protein
MGEELRAQVLELAVNEEGVVRKFRPSSLCSHEERCVAPRLPAPRGHMPAWTMRGGWL